IKILIVCAHYPGGNTRKTARNPQGPQSGGKAPMKRARARPGAVVALLAAAGVLAGCAGPEFTYVRDSSGKADLQVPAGWRKVDQKALDRLILGDPDSEQPPGLQEPRWPAAHARGPH